MRQLLLYGFGPQADFEGRLVGALERLESGGALRILDVLFVRRDAVSGDIDAIDLHGDGAGGVVGAAAQLPPGRRRAPSRDRARAARRHRGRARARRRAGAGSALAAVLVDHVWSDALDDAASRSGGRLLAGNFVDATSLSELGPELLAAAGRRAG
jgi:hypothetical protein